MVAIRTTAPVRPPGLLSIKFLPNAVYKPVHRLQVTFAAASAAGWPLDRVNFEVTEHEAIVDHDHLVGILRCYQAHAFPSAVDDFGARFAGLNLLGRLPPDLVRLDIGLVRNPPASRPRQVIVRAMVDICAQLGIRPLAEGVETFDECHALADLEIDLQQGFLFARPSLEPALPMEWPTLVDGL